MKVDTPNTGWMDSDCILADRVLGHLEKIEASALFAGTRRLKFVLRYLVHRALDGTSADLNEYRIAVEAFGKGEAFDPTTDPIVRVEMSRLRTRLERYYRDYIVDDDLSFELPRGTYALAVRDAAAGNVMPSSLGGAATITIAISPLHAAPSTSDAERLCVQLTGELVEILGNESYLSAVAHGIHGPPRLDQRLAADTERWPDVDFILDGTIQTWSPLVYATMRLTDIRRGIVHVLGHYVYDMQRTFTPRMDLPSAILADIRSHLLTSRNGPGPESAQPGRYSARHGRRGQSATTIDTIVEAAVGTFADHGYFGATIEAIALRARVAERFVLEQFGNKVILFIESARMSAHRTLDLPHIDEPQTIGETQRKTLQGALLVAIRDWYSTLTIERARLSIYAGLQENVEYQSLIQEPIARMMRHRTTSRIAEANTRWAEIDIRSAAENLIVFLIYFRVAPWSPDIKEAHDEVAGTIVKQSLACLFDRAMH